MGLKIKTMTRERMMKLQRVPKNPVLRVLVLGPSEDDVKLKQSILEKEIADRRAERKANRSAFRRVATPVGFRCAGCLMPFASAEERRKHRARCDKRKDRKAVLS